MNKQESSKPKNPSRRRFFAPRSTEQGASESDGDARDAEIAAVAEAAAEGDPEKARDMLRDPVMYAAIAAVAGAGLLTSRPAHAVSAGAIASAVEQVISQVMKPVIDGAVGVITDSYSNEMDTASDKTATAVGMGSQGVIDTIKDKHDAEVLQDSRPAPSSCVTDGASKVVDYGQKRASDYRQRASAFTAGDYMNGGKYQSKVAREEMLKRESDFPKDEDLNAANFLNADGYDADQEKAAEAFSRRMRGQRAIDNISITEAEKRTVKGTIFELQKTGIGARGNVAETALHESMSRRSRSREMADALKAAIDAEGDLNDWDKNRLEEMTRGTGGVSLLDVMNFEVDRRYKSPDWRALMADPPSSVPVLREMANMLALQNHMLLEDYKQNELTMLTEASMLSRMVEQEADELIKSYSGIS